MGTPKTAPKASSLVKYPEAQNCTASDVKKIQAEYNALKALEEPNEAQVERKNMLLALGRKANAIAKARKAAEEKEAGEGEDDAKDTPTVDMAALAVEMNEVMNLTPPIDVEDTDALEATIRQEAKEIREDDFEVIEGKASFTRKAKDAFVALGIKLPLEKEIPPKTKKVSKKVQPPAPPAEEEEEKNEEAAEETSEEPAEPKEKKPKSKINRNSKYGRFDAAVDAIRATKSRDLNVVFPKADELYVANGGNSSVSTARLETYRVLAALEKWGV